MSVDSDALAEVLQELMSPATTTSVDIPTFRSNPVEMTLKAAEACGVTMTADELRLVSQALVHPVAIGTWNLIDRSQDDLEISGLEVARSAFRYAVTMHTIMVLLGLALLGASLGASLNGSAQLAAAIGALGLGSFTALFLIAPLQDLYRSLGTRVQLEIIGLGHQRQMDLYRMYAKTTQESAHFLIDAEVLPRITMIAERTVTLVENLGQPIDLAVGTAAQSAASGALPIMMAVPGAPGVSAQGPKAVVEGPKVPLEKIAVLDKPAVMDAPPPASQEGDSAPDSSEVPVQQRTKVPLEKTLVMDKPPVAEAPPTPKDPGTDSNDKPQGSD